MEDEDAVESDEELRVEDVGAGSAGVPRPLFAPSVPAEEVWFGGKWTKKSAAAPVSSFWEKDCWGTCDYPSECRWGKQFGAAQTQAQAHVVAAPAVAVPSPPPPPPPSMVFEPVSKDLEMRDRSAEKIASVPTTIEEMAEPDGTGEPSEHRHEEPLATAQETTKKPTFDDLLESVKRRKRRSAGPLHSPLASNPPLPTTEQEESQAASAHTLQKAFDDFELDLKKSIGRASVLLNGFVLGLKGSGATDEEKAEAFVKGLRTDRKKKRSSAKEEDAQSLSD